MSKLSSEIRGWGTIVATLTGIIQILAWLMIWGNSIPPTVASTSRAGGTPVANQYWILILSVLLPVAVWKQWNRWVVIMLVGMCLCVWILRINGLRQYGS
jgi:hypothetical protein